MIPHKNEILKLTSFRAVWLLTILASFFLTLPVAAQIHPLSVSKERGGFISRPSFYVVLAGGITRKGELANEEGENILRSTARPYLEPGIDYQHPIRNNFYFLTGLHLAAVGRNIRLTVPVDSAAFPGFNGQYSQGHTDFSFGIAVPLFIEKYWGNKSNGSFFINGGVQLHYLPGTGSDKYRLLIMDSSRTLSPVLDADLNTNHQGKPWVSCALGGGYHMKCKSGNSLAIGLQADLSFTRFVQGFYTVKLSGIPESRSSYGISGTYLAIKAAYGFTKPGKKTVSGY